jgi:DNA topoisomerase IB
MTVYTLGVPQSLVPILEQQYEDASTQCWETAAGTCDAAARGFGYDVEYFIPEEFLPRVKIIDRKTFDKNALREMGQIPAAMAPWVKWVGQDSDLEQVTKSPERYPFGEQYKMYLSRFQRRAQHLTGEERAEVRGFLKELMQMRPPTLRREKVQDNLERRLQEARTRWNEKKFNDRLREMLARLEELLPDSGKTAAKYKDKKTVKTQDGGKMTVYEYSDRQVATRNKAKAEQVEKLRGSIGKLREQVQKDLKSDDTHTKAVALAVGLMDLTFERVGNPSSAKDGHFGVTGWKVKHLTFGNGKVTIKYVGKSGVDHEKVVDKATSVKALKEAIKGKGPEEEVVDCSAEDVNEYLKPFGITAKDLRGYHANTEMQTRLKAVRSKGGKLPEDKKEREKKLKTEFKKALAETADAVGHESATLRNQYLVPGLEEEYLKDGAVSEKLIKKKAFTPGFCSVSKEKRLAQRWIQAAEERVKYPRTRHLPWSPGRSRDDLILTDTSQFEGKQVVVTEKMDGENCTIGRNYTHARSINERPHPSRDWVKQFGAQVGLDIPDGWRLCGENLFAKHSIGYDELPSYFLLFSIWNENNVCLSWDETEEYAQLLGVKTVPVLYRGPWDEERIKAIFDGKSKMSTGPAEGYVVRNAGSFHYSAFDKNIAKFVRSGHVQSETHWMEQDVVPNKLIKKASRIASYDIKQDPFRWCPVCGSFYVTQTKGVPSAFECPKGHSWVWCPVHTKHVLVPDAWDVPVVSREACLCRIGTLVLPKKENPSRLEKLYFRVVAPEDQSPERYESWAQGLGKAASDARLQDFLTDFTLSFPYLRGLLARVKVVENSHLTGEARQAAGNRIELGEKFWTHQIAAAQNQVFAHELGHWLLSEYGLQKFLTLTQEYGVDVWALSSLPYSAHNFDEAFAECFASWVTERQNVKRRYPEWVSLVEELFQTVR